MDTDIHYLYTTKNVYIVNLLYMHAENSGKVGRRWLAAPLVILYYEKMFFESVLQKILFFPQ